jgi:hypothetical protein
MAYVVANKSGTFEAREARNTPDGPRSRTLATFRDLDRATIEKILDRASKATSAADLRSLALRAGAPIARAPVDAAAQSLLGSLARGERLQPKLHRLLENALAGELPSEAEWLDKSPGQRGEALEQLLLLADAVPIRRRPDKIGFPRLDSTEGSLA